MHSGTLLLVDLTKLYLQCMSVQLSRVGQAAPPHDQSFYTIAN